MQRSKTLKEKTATGIVWSFIDKFGQQGLYFIVGIILARYFLSPTDYALVAMVFIINALGNILVDSGFSNALIRKQDVTQTDLSSVFYFNIVISLLFYLLIFFCAPLFALYFQQPILTKLARTMALCIPLYSLTLIQITLLAKAINFKRLASVNLIALFCSGSLSIFLAWKGLGVWVLVIQYLIFNVVRNICLWSFSTWYPNARYSMQSIKNLWNYSSKLLLSSIIAVIFNNIYVFFMGKIYPMKDIGYYNQANKYSELSYTTIMSAIQTSVYSAMANTGEHNNEGLKKILRKTVRVSSFILLPIILGLIATAEPLVHTLLDTKWLPIVPYMQILCIGYLFLGMTTSYNNILFIKGLSSTFLRFNIFYRALILLSILFTMYKGIAIMLIAWSIVATFYALFLMFFIGKKIHYTFFEQIKDIIPYFTLAIFMGAGVFFFSFIIENHVILLLTQIMIGATFYLGANYLLGSKVFREVIEIIKKKEK